MAYKFGPVGPRSPAGPAIQHDPGRDGALGEGPWHDIAKRLRKHLNTKILEAMVKHDDAQGEEGPESAEVEAAEGDDGADDSAGLKRSAMEHDQQGPATASGKFAAGRKKHVVTPPGKTKGLKK